MIVLTGFLGAGKTTLVNRLLARGRLGRVGVVVNELGAVGIDGALLGGDVARQVELPGGCVCCTLGDDLERTLLELVEGRDLQAILIETTGVAEPIPIAWALGREPANEKLRCAAVVTVVDALGFEDSRAVTTAVDAQVAYADVLLVTKAPLSEPARIAIRALAPRAPLREGTTDDHAAYLESLLEDPDIARVGVEHPHDHASHRAIGSVSVAVSGTLDLEELEEQLAALPAEMVRIKGIVRAVDPRVGDDEVWTAVHRVGLRVSSERVAAPSGWQEGKIVALGTGIDVEQLAAAVAASGAP